MNNIWSYFSWVFALFLSAWLVGAAGICLPGKKTLPIFRRFGPLFAIVVVIAFIVLLWLSLGRPPMKTMAETRLWYSFFSACITYLIFLKTKSKTLYITGFAMSTAFMLTELIHPEYRTQNLMPSLQSAWFIPHVIVYIIAYAILGAAWITSMSEYLRKKSQRNHELTLQLSMNLVYPGFALLSIGMIFGAWWAKIAWGDYWAWDPKETWALLTWLFYLILIHYRKYNTRGDVIVRLMLSLSFLVLIITWLGIRYFPSAAGSVHVYAN